MSNSLSIVCPCCGSREVAERTSAPREYEIAPHTLPTVYTTAFRQGGDPENLHVSVDSECAGSRAKVTIQ